MIDLKPPQLSKEELKRLGCMGVVLGWLFCMAVVLFLISFSTAVVVWTLRAMNVPI